MIQKRGSCDVSLNVWQYCITVWTSKTSQKWHGWRGGALAFQNLLGRDIFVYLSYRCPLKNALIYIRKEKMELGLMYRKPVTSFSFFKKFDTICQFPLYFLPLLKTARWVQKLLVLFIFSCVELVLTSFFSHSMFKRTAKNSTILAFRPRRSHIMQRFAICATIQPQNTKASESDVTRFWRRLVMLSMSHSCWQSPSTCLRL